MAFSRDLFFEEGLKCSWCHIGIINTGSFSPDKFDSPFELISLVILAGCFNIIAKNNKSMNLFQQETIIQNITMNSTF